MTNENQYMNNLELRQQQMIMFGVNEKNKVKLTEQEIKQVQKNYVGMYYGFVSINWSQGMTLGMAWQKALQQMDAFVETKTRVPNHPLNEHLIKMHTEFRRDMSKKIMTSENAECKLNPKLKQSFANYGMSSLKKNKSVLDDLHKNYMPQNSIDKTQTTKSLKDATQKTQELMQQLMLQQMIKSRAA